LYFSRFHSTTPVNKRKRSLFRVNKTPFGKLFELEVKIKINILVTFGIQIVIEFLKSFHTLKLCEEFNKFII
jgi:hypothetical protein